MPINYRGKESVVQPGIIFANIARMLYREKFKDHHEVNTKSIEAGITGNEIQDLLKSF